MSNCQVPILCTASIHSKEEAMLEMVTHRNVRKTYHLGQGFLNPLSRAELSGDGVLMNLKLP
jgi:hypothetical protein